MVDCPDCGKSFDSELGLRTHARFTDDHDEADILDQVSSDSSTSSEETVEEGKDNSEQGVQGEQVEAENTVDLSEEIEGLKEESEQDSSEDSQEESEEENSSSSSTDSEQPMEFSQGIDDVVNKVFGHGMTWDMDPEDPEREKELKRMKAIARDVDLGQNTKVVWNKYMESRDEMTPEQALMMSLGLAILLGVVQRPEAGKKAWKKLQKSSPGNSTSETEEAEEDEDGKES